MNAKSLPFKFKDQDGQDLDSLRHALHHLPLLILIYNANFELEFASGMPLAQHEIDAQKILKKSMHKIQKALPVSKTHLSKALTGEAITALHEYQGRIYEVTYCPVPEKAPSPTKQVVCMASDVTAKIQAEKLLVEQQAGLTNSSRLVALGEMAGGMAHEINNPMTIILGNCGFLESLLKSSPIDPQKALGRLEKIRHTAERVSRIIRSLLHISSGDHGDHFKITHIPDLINNCLEITRERFASHQVELLYDHKGQSESVCQPARLAQALLNLLGNGLDAAQSLPQRWVHVESVIDSQTTAIRITDAGHGIPKELHQKIFQPFFTTKDIQKGTGVGLSLVKSVMDKHLGQVGVDPRHPNTSFVLSWNHEILRPQIS